MKTSVTQAQDAPKQYPVLGKTAKKRGVRGWSTWLLVAAMTSIAFIAVGVRFYAFAQPNGIISIGPFARAVDVWLFSHRLPLIVHMLGAATFLFLAPFQLSSRGAKFHKLIGRIAGVAIIVSMFIAVPLSLLFNLESPLARLTTCLGALLVLWFVVAGVIAAAKKNAERHRRFVLAAYLLLLATSLERVWLRLFIHFTLAPPQQIINFWVPVFSSAPIIISLFVGFWPASEKIEAAKRKLVHWWDGNAFFWAVLGASLLAGLPFTILFLAVEGYRNWQSKRDMERIERDGYESYNLQSAT